MEVIHGVDVILAERAYGPDHFPAVGKCYILRVTGAETSNMSPLRRTVADEGSQQVALGAEAYGCAVGVGHDDLRAYRQPQSVVLGDEDVQRVRLKPGGGRRVRHLLLVDPHATYAGQPHRGVGVGVGCYLLPRYHQVHESGALGGADSLPVRCARSH